jgi:replicative DNA helicase
MSKEQLVGRAQSNLSEIDSSRIIKKQLSLDEVDAIERSCAELKTAPIYIDDTPSLSLMELKGKARKLVRDKGVQMIVIDYLQLMTVEVGKNGNREQEVGLISKGLKALAKELNIPIIALSQLNRAVESRADKKPLLSDLRESGNIEQDADMVIFCYRPEYYGIPQYEMGSELLQSENLMVLILAKHRSGTLGELRLGFNGMFTKLESYETLLSKKLAEHNPFANEIKPNPEANDFNNTNNGFIDDEPF